jgi:hypothetical protein
VVSQRQFRHRGAARFEPGGALNLPPTAMGHVALVMLGLAIVSVIGIHVATTAAPVFAEIAAQR